MPEMRNNIIEGKDWKGIYINIRNCQDLVKSIF